MTAISDPDGVREDIQNLRDINVVSRQFGFVPIVEFDALGFRGVPHVPSP
jgi:hypothetical protein